MKKILSKRMKAVKSEKGFTLVELLATIVILGIIAAIAVPSIGGLMEKTKTNAHTANEESVEEAARLYIVAEEYESGTLTDTQLVPDYLEEIPEDPQTGSAYTTLSVAVADGKVTGVTLSSGTSSP
ncbi:type II secretion system protein [Pseudalkalibacillus berkeleyi]|uniref:Type II secretion system GspH family protein n=1 Tax=Pseudalkalibacillus berkeleyi TaxID=1069813 RepID=A0ABS9H2B3_9BACL|nr:type II secretion system protein [Pseudalkalibacillus berkeleyi]MCF6138105.1 type II secretion system GspH family protein [Pseudalkalibacillus berkeleyi]